MPLRWLRDGLCARGQHAGHPFWYVRATSHHSDALLHKGDWAASQDTVLQNPRTLATPNSLSPAVTAISIYGPPRCGCSARLLNGRRRTMR